MGIFRYEVSHRGPCPTRPHPTSQYNRRSGPSKTPAWPSLWPLLSPDTGPLAPALEPPLAGPTGDSQLRVDLA